MRESAKHRDHSVSNLGIEILQELLLLRDEIVGDARAESLALRVACRVVARPSLASARCSTYPFLTSVRDDAAGRALVEEQPLRERTEPHRAVLHERLERVALGDRDVVAADAIAVAELVDADQVGDGRVQRGGIAIERMPHGVLRGAVRSTT